MRKIQNPAYGFRKSIPRNTFESRIQKVRRGLSWIYHFYKLAALRVSGLRISTFFSLSLSSKLPFNRGGIGNWGVRFQNPMKSPRFHSAERRMKSIESMTNSTRRNCSRIDTREGVKFARKLRSRWIKTEWIMYGISMGWKGH